MMDINEQIALNDIIIQNSANAKTYADTREKAAIAKYKLDLLAGAKYLSDKLNVRAAYEKALILIACENEDNKSLYKDFIKYTAQYKGLEKILEANADAIRWAQSKMKYEKENT